MHIRQNGAFQATLSNDIDWLSKKNMKVQVAILLHSLGDDAVEIYNTFEIAKEAPEEVTVDKIANTNDYQRDPYSLLISYSSPQRRKDQTGWLCIPEVPKGTKSGGAIPKGVPSARKISRSHIH